MILIAPMAAAAIIQAGIAATSAGVKYARGRKQKKQADKLAAMPRPTKEVAPGAEAAYKKAALSATSSKMPGQVAIEEMMGQRAADVGQAAQSAGSPYASINAASAAQGAYGNQINKLGVSSAANKMDRERFAEETRAGLTASQEGAKDYNIFQPYQEAKAAESALRGASIANTSGAFNQAAEGASNYAMNRTYGKALGTGGEGEVVSGAESPTQLAQGAQTATTPQYTPSGKEQGMINELSQAKSAADRDAIFKKYGIVI